MKFKQLLSHSELFINNNLKNTIQNKNYTVTLKFNILGRCSVIT